MTSPELHVQRIVTSLGLIPHPEGGWFRETWRTPSTIETTRGIRNSATGIHYLLGAADTSAWHRVIGSQEVWLWQGGGQLTISSGGFGPAPLEINEHVLGPAHTAAQTQHILAGDEWQSARVSSGDYVLVACVVSPGFDFADWEIP